MHSSIERRRGGAFFLVSLLSGGVPVVLQNTLGDQSWVVASTLATVLLVGVGVGATLARKLSGELRTLSHFASRVSRGDLSENAGFQQPSVERVAWSCAWAI